MLDRRTFLGTLGAAWLAGPRLATAKLDRIGMQLYTVRTALEKDFDGTLAKVAAIGYREVEFAGYFDHTPKQVREVLDRHGLTAPAAHVDYPSLGEKFPAVLDAAKTIGHRYLVNPWVDESIRTKPGAWKEIAATLNRAGERSRQAGIQFAYHNHHFEFAPDQSLGGKRPYDVLLAECDPSLVQMELDLCWITAAGQDPLDYFKQYPGRFPLVHVKGLGRKPAAGARAPIDSVLPDITDVGTSDVIDWKRIVAHAKEAGIRHYFVEHDVPKDPFESLRASYTYLESLEF